MHRFKDVLFIWNDMKVLFATSIVSGYNIHITTLIKGINYPGE